MPLSRLFLSASSHDPHVSPQVLLLGSRAGQSSYLVMNAHTGQVLEKNSLPGTIEKVNNRLQSVQESSVEPSITRVKQSWTQGIAVASLKLSCKAYYRVTQLLSI